MLQNYIIIALRNLLRNKSFAFIHLTGLAVGLAGCMLIGLYIQNELSYDRYHDKSDRIFRLTNQTEGGTYENGIAKVCGPWGPAAKEKIAEVEEVGRFVFYGRTLVGEGEERFYESGGLFADASVFDIFSWKLIKGSPATVLAKPNSVVLTKALAEKYFPNADPLGQTMTFDNDQKYIVTGVVEDVPENSHFTFRFLVSLNTYEHPDRESWTRWNQFYTYLLLKPGTDPAIISKKFNNILSENIEADLASAITPIMQPITGIHLHSKLHREMAVNSDVSYVYIFGAIALFLLLIACLNFINLSTAKATQRAKEIGVRKVTGATQSQLIRQFLSETMVICLLAVGLAVMLAQLALPEMNRFLGRELTLNFFENGTLVFGLLAMVVLTGLLSGSYPAFLLSSFRPVEVLKSKLSPSGNIGIRKALVVFQFTISIFLIIAALVVTRQLDFIQNKNLGFNKEQIINVPMQDRATNPKSETIKTELLKVPGVLKVAVSANQPGGSDYGVPYEAVGLSGEQQPAMRCLVIDHDFVDTYEMELAAGRSFSENMPTDETAYMINETAAKQLGWSNPLEHQLAMPAVNRPAGPIIGVVKDFHFRSLHEPIAPLYIFYQPTWFSQFNIKLDATHLEETLSLLEEEWKTIEPDFPFRYTFFDESYESLHAAEQSTGKLIKWFTALAIFITCLGLFGLTIFAAESRIKEIGIRKVLGASAAGIVGLLSKDFLKLVLLALVIASPLAYYFMKEWLHGFAYHVELQWTIFILAGLIAFFIAFLTMSFHSIKAALANPVESLRNE